MSVLPDRTRAEVANARGLAQIEAGDLAAATESFRAALESDGFYGPAHSNLGIVLMQAGQPFDAAWHLRYACQLMPKASQPRANLGILYELVGKYGAAEEQLRSALVLSPDDIEVIGHLARVHVRQHKWTDETSCWFETLATRDDDAVWRSWGQETAIRHRQSLPRE